MADVLICGVFALVVLVFSGMLWQDKARGLATVFVLAGVALLIAFGRSVHDNFKDGSPVSEISPGTYKVGFVYQAGPNVSVGIEKPKGDKDEHLSFYQFPLSDFEDSKAEIKIGSKKLITAYKLTTGNGTFNRYKLE